MGAPLSELGSRVGAVASQIDDYAHRYERLHDSRAVFAHVYALMTRVLADELRAGQFDDPEWVVTVDEAFGARFFEAMDAFDTGADPPGGWAPILAALAKRRTSVTEDLVLALVAHISYDLPLALVEAGLTDNEGRPHLKDFHTLNRIIGEQIGTIQDAVVQRYNPYIKWLDRVGRNYDEFLTDYGTQLGRGMAWYNACRLQDPATKADAEASIAERPRVVVEQLLNPPVLTLRLLLRASRLLGYRLRRWPADSSAGDGST